MKRYFRSAPILIPLLVVVISLAAEKQPSWSEQEKPIAEQIAKLRSLPDDVRAHITRDLALQIRQLPASANRLRLAMGLANRATEGDFGHDTLQEVATTLESAIREQHSKQKDSYLELASLVRYEHLNASVESPEFSSAISKLEVQDRERENANFTLTDLNGKTW